MDAPHKAGHDEGKNNLAEALFYHLEGRTLEDVLPGLLERTRERGLRAVVRVGSAERMAALDTQLWTYSEQTFLAHGTGADGHSERQPIYLTTEDENPNNAEVLFLVGGAAPCDWSSPKLKSLARIVMLFDGRDATALEAARAAWKSAKTAGHDATYWKQSAAGKWEKQNG
jgi:DNA polymerase-3 subunit chi